MPAADNSREAVPHASCRLANALLLSLAALWCIYWFVHAWHYWEDDAYIHLEFARSVAQGHGFAFNGRIVAGDTSPQWVLLLAGMHALIPNWLAAGKTLSVLGAAVGFAGVYAFARRMAARLPLAGGGVFPAAMVLLIAVNPYTCYWIFSGMEAFAAAGLACFAVLQATSEVASTEAFMTGCLLAGVAPLVRPEMIFLTALLAWPLLGQWRRLRKSRAKLVVLAAGAALICGPLALWSLYSLHAFGHIFPNTNAAKRDAPGHSVVRHLLSIYSLGFPLILCGLLAGAVYLLLRTSAVRRSLGEAMRSAFRSSDPRSASLPLAGWILLLWPLITAAFYIANHTYVQTRYILATGPELSIVIVALALMASPRTGRVVYVAALLAAVAISLVTVRPFVRNKGINCQVNRDLALFVRDRIPPDAPVAAYAIGELAFISEHPIVDTSGITRPEALPYLNDPPPPMLRWAQSQGAEYIAGAKPGPDAVRVFTGDGRFIGWTFHTDRFQRHEPIELWRFAPLPQSPQQAAVQRAVSARP